MRNLHLIFVVVVILFCRASNRSIMILKARVIDSTTHERSLFDLRVEVCYKLPCSAKHAVFAQAIVVMP